MCTTPPLGPWRPEHPPCRKSCKGNGGEGHDPHRAPSVCQPCPWGSRQFQQRQSRPVATLRTQVHAERRDGQCPISQMSKRGWWGQCWMQTAVRCSVLIPEVQAQAPELPSHAPPLVIPGCNEHSGALDGGWGPCAYLPPPPTGRFRGSHGGAWRRGCRLPEAPWPQNLQSCK